MRRLVVLLYHRVLAAPDALRPGDPDEREFDRHMRLLKRWFVPMPLREAVTRTTEGTLPARAVCVTFDDGYEDNLTRALPILVRHGIPATIFVTSGYIDGGIMWNDVIVEAVHSAPARLDLSEAGLGQYRLESASDRARAVADLLPALKYVPFEERQARCARIAAIAGVSPESPMMTRSQLRRLAESPGIDIGAHSVTHPILKGLDHATATHEIAGSGRALEEMIGRRVNGFAYPNGKPGSDYDDETTDIVRAAGYDYALATCYGSAGRETNRYAIPRISPWDRNMAKLGLRLLALGGTSSLNEG